MITILSGKLTIPEDERFIGFSGDDQSRQVELLLMHFTARNSVYELGLRFDDGTVRTVPLEAERHDSDVLLTWKVQRDQLYSPGVVTAQLKIISGDGRVIHSTRDYFLVGGNTDGDSSDDDYVTVKLLEQRLGDVRAKLPYVNENGAFIVGSDGDVRIAKSDEVYSKDEIDEMIRDIKTQLNLT